MPKRVRNFGFFSEPVFHPLFEGLPVVARPSGENFPSPFNQFQSIGEKKIQIPIPCATYMTNLQFRTLWVHFIPFNEKFALHETELSVILK